MALLNLSITQSTRDYLSGLDPKPYRQMIEKVLDLLKNPTPNDSIQMKGYPYFRADIGEQRIVYHFDDTTLYIAIIGKRNDDEA